MQSEIKICEGIYKSHDVRSDVIVETIQNLMPKSEGFSSLPEIDSHIITSLVDLACRFS